MRISYENMIEMKRQGATYTEIAKILGVSRQRVHQMLLHYDNSVKGIRGHGFRIDTIIFKGIYEHFKNDMYESLTSFTEKVHNNQNKKIPDMRKFITGKSNSKFTIQQIQRICEITGMSFEETFAIRETEGADVCKI